MATFHKLQIFKEFFHSQNRYPSYYFKVAIFFWSFDLGQYFFGLQTVKPGRIWEYYHFFQDVQTVPQIAQQSCGLI